MASKRLADGNDDENNSSSNAVVSPFDDGRVEGDTNSSGGEESSAVTSHRRGIIVGGEKENILPGGNVTTAIELNDGTPSSANYAATSAIIKTGANDTHESNSNNDEGLLSAILRKQSISFAVKQPTNNNHHNNEGCDDEDCKCTPPIMEIDEDDSVYNGDEDFGLLSKRREDVLVDSDEEEENTGNNVNEDGASVASVRRNHTAGVSEHSNINNETLIEDVTFDNIEMLESDDEDEVIQLTGRKAIKARTFILNSDDEESDDESAVSLESEIVKSSPSILGSNLLVESEAEKEKEDDAKSSSSLSISSAASNFLRSKVRGNSIKKRIQLDDDKSSSSSEEEWVELSSDEEDEAEQHVERVNTVVILSSDEEEEESESEDDDDHSTFTISDDSDSEKSDASSVRTSTRKSNTKTRSSIKLKPHLTARPKPKPQFTTPKKTASTKIKPKSKPSQTNTKATTLTFRKNRDTITSTTLAEFNQYAFNNTLSSVKVEWSNKLNTTAGVTRMRGKLGQENAHTRVATIELATKVIDDEQRLRSTLLHELCHAAAWLVDGVHKPPHGKCFKKWASISMKKVSCTGAK